MNKSHSEEESALKPMNEAVLAVLIKNRSEFRRFLAKRTGSESLAEDLLQQSFLKALHHPINSQAELGILSWFYTILKNTQIDHYRAQSTRDKTLEGFMREMEIEDKNHVPASEEIKESICQCMEGLLPTIKPEYAEILRAVDLKEETPASVAQRMGITLGNLNVRLHRARLALKKRLEEVCGVCTEHGCLNCTCDE